MNTKPTIYLHIGAGKTGTTSIQTWLKQSQHHLHENGYLIFDSNFTPNPVNGLMSNQQQFFQNINQYTDGGISAFQSQFRENLSYMRAHNYHSAVISAEFILISLPQLSTWLTPFLEECTWKIIVYVRNQPQYLISSWKEWGYWQYSFDDMFSHSSHLRANWYELIQPWATIFRKDQLYVGIFDSAYLINQSIIHDFITAINLPHLVADSVRHISTNPSLNNKSALLLNNIRAHNLQRPSKVHVKPKRADFATDEAYSDAVRIYTKKLRERFQLKPILINRARTTSTEEHDSAYSLATQDQLDFIYERFKESNAKLIAEYRPDIDATAAFPRVITNNHVNYTDSEIIYHGFQLMLEVTHEFMNQQKKQNEHLQLQSEQIRTINQKLQHHTQQLWSSMQSHDESLTNVHEQFIGVQHQLEHVQEQFKNLNYSSQDLYSRTNPVKYWIIRLWNKFMRRS